MKIEPFGKFPYYEYSFTISEDCKKEDGYYHIFIKNWEGEIKETVCRNKQVKAQEFVPPWDKPKFLEGIDIYQFTNISIHREDYED